MAITVDDSTALAGAEMVVRPAVAIATARPAARARSAGRSASRYVFISKAPPKASSCGRRFPPRSGGADHEVGNYDSVQCLCGLPAWVRYQEPEHLEFRNP